MTGVSLTVDRAQWDAHLQAAARSVPGLVPVAKGNGYGFGLARLAAEAAALGVTTMAVGTARELASVRDHFPGDVVVLTPWQSSDPAARQVARDPHVVLTICDLDELAALRRSAEAPRVLVEVLTSMRRHGLEVDRLPEVPAALGDAQLDGWTIHLPLASPRSVRRGEGPSEALTLARAAVDAARAPVWFSHVPGDAYGGLGEVLGVDTHLRLGTSLWLSPQVKRRTSATVLDVHPVRRGERIGYWQRAMPQAGHVVVVAGGTAHGIALEAPTTATTLRRRAIALVNGSLEAVGLARSPYTIAGAKRWFVEPPHMQSSLIFLPAPVAPPSVGDDVDVELRLTTATVDDVVFEG